MRGLICKEFIYLRRLSPLILIAFIPCAYTLSTLGPSRQSAIMCGVNICVFTSLLGLSLVVCGPFYDEKSHWNRFARSLPISPRRIVGSRYLCVLLIIVTSVLLSVATVLVTAHGQTDWDTLTRILSFSVGLPVILFSIFLPLCYMLPAPVMGFAAMPLIIPLIVWDMAYQKGRCSDLFAYCPPLFFFLIALVFSVASFFISVRIYSKKEF